MTKKTAKKPIALVKVITDAAAINTAITSIGKRGKTLDRDMHTVAVSCLIHADKHGDITLANRLIEVMPKTARTNALKDWFLAFGKFSYDADNKCFAFNKTATTQTKAAMATPFWEFKPEADYVALDAVKFLENAIKRVESAMNRGDDVPEALAKGLAGLLTTITTPTTTLDARTA